MRPAVGCLILLVLLAIGALAAREYGRRYPQNVPWTALDLRHPVGTFTGRKLAALGDEPRQCLALLRQADALARSAPARRASADCGYGDGVRLSLGGKGRAGFAPAGLVAACPVAAAMLLLEREVIQPAAMRHLGSTVTQIDHFGSYSCRRLYGRDEGPFSAHATADAIDISGFRLADGSRVSVLRDWSGDGPEAAFLREVRDGSCRLFSTVLSPDYNAAHADHLHLDQAERGAAGWRLCR